jgi:uncharacterized protein
LIKGEKDMNFPQEYIEYLVHFHGDRDYFECHEILEDYWKKIDNGNKESIWVGLIQLAVANYHHRRKNFNGAQRTLEKSLNILTLHEEQLKTLGIHSTVLFQQMKQQLLNIKKTQLYCSYHFPLISHKLITLCIEKSQQLRLTWCSLSNLQETDIIHRHLKRDRTDVINERKRAILNKRNKR